MLLASGLPSPIAVITAPVGPQQPLINRPVAKMRRYGAASVSEGPNRKSNICSGEAKRGVAIARVIEAEIDRTLRIYERSFIGLCEAQIEAIVGGAVFTSKVSGKLTIAASLAAAEYNPVNSGEATRPTITTSPDWYIGVKRVAAKGSDFKKSDSGLYLDSRRRSMKGLPNTLGDKISRVSVPPTDKLQIASSAVVSCSCGKKSTAANAKEDAIGLMLTPPVLRIAPN